MGYEIEELGGNCPVQAEGYVGTDTGRAGDGNPFKFYFRARGSSWSFTVFGAHAISTRFSAEGEWGDADYVAGWMPEDAARELIEMCVKLYDLQERQTIADVKERAEAEAKP